MSFQVRIFTKEEKEAYWAKQKANARKDREIGDQITYHPAREESVVRKIGWFKPWGRSCRPTRVEIVHRDPRLTCNLKTHESNLMSYQKWLKHVVR